MIILGTNSIKDTGYNVANSYRSNSGDSPKLSKTFSSASNSNTTFTVSAWVKRSKLGANQDVVSAFRSSDGLQTDLIRFGSGDDLEFYAHTTNSSGNADIQTNRLFRDVGAWYHIVVRVDTTQGTDTNRVRIYVNGVQETSFSTSNYMNQNGTIIWGLGSGTEHTIGAVGTSNYFGGYVAEVVYLDSQSVAPTTFGEFDDDSGIWKPINVSGLTFGNNSFYLDFENSAELGTDASGNSHTFTENNIAATDQSTDTCTNNFATLNPLYTNTTSDIIFANGNLDGSMTDNTKAGSYTTIGMTSGKFYCEVKIIEFQNAGEAVVGVSGRPASDMIDNKNVGDTTQSVGYRTNGQSEIASTTASYGDSYTTNDIIGIALDVDNSKLYFSKNGTFQNSGDPTSGSTGTGALSMPVGVSSCEAGAYFFGFGDNTTASSSAHKFSFNFGSPSFAISSGNTDAEGFGNFEFAVPSGYFSLNSKNLAEYG